MKLMLEAMERSRQEGQACEELQGQVKESLSKAGLSEPSGHADGSGRMGGLEESRGRARRSRYAAAGGAGLVLLAAAGVFFMPKLLESTPPFAMVPMGDAATASVQAVMEVPARVVTASSSIGETPSGSLASTPKNLQAEPDPLPKVASPEPKALRKVSGSAVLPAKVEKAQVEVPVEKPAASTTGGTSPRLIKVSPKEGTSAAWQALRDGRLDEAETLYREVLNARPHDVDALVGLASLLHRRGEREKAWDAYRQVLAQAPDNATAITGTMTLLSESDPAIAESRLKDLIDLRPQEGSLQVALGHLFGRQGRWSEAQVAFFAAFKLQPNSAINAYNLAVALDHLHQYGPALNFYRTALASATANEIPMDSARQRIDALNK